MLDSSPRAIDKHINKPYNCDMTTEQDLIKQAMYSTKLSRLLAQENIGVEFVSGAETASFYPGKRTLVFPYNTAMLDSDIHELFMLHEVSHALHLPTDAMQIFKKAGVDHSLTNVVLDIRDERLIKEKFPSAAKIMRAGYAKLLNQDFFGPRNKLKFRKFADRLNVFAKCGVTLVPEIKFTSEEMDFYNRCMKAETLEDVIALSKELEKMIDVLSDDLRNELMDMLREEFDADGKSIIYQDLGDDDDDDEESEEPKELTEEELNELIDEMREKAAQDIFDEKFKQSNLENALVVSYTSLVDYDRRIVSAKRYTNFLTEKFTAYGQTVADSTANARERRKEIQQSVDAMVRVFESKKAANRRKNAKMSDTGYIDMNKVHRYGFDDKIFSRAMNIPDAKNHGYYILLDFSGSMHRIYKDVIEQTLVLTEFFRRIQVPYKVMAFGACLDTSLSPFPYGNDQYPTNPSPSICKSIRNEYLVELLSSDQTIAEHNMAITGMFRQTGVSLGSTPTVGAMLIAEGHARDFFAKARVDRKNMVVITDGEPTDSAVRSYDYYYSKPNKTLLMADPVTKQVVRGDTQVQYSVVNCIGKIFENRYGLKFTTISIVSGLTARGSVVHNFTSTSPGATDLEMFRKDGYAKLKDGVTNSEVYFARPNKIDVDVTGFDISEKKTTSQIARSMISNMKHVKKSRNFLNSLVETLS